MPNEINGLEKLPNSIEEIQKNPILKPLLDYKTGAIGLMDDEENEKSYLDKEKTELDELLKTNIYNESPIVQRYEKVLSVYKRYLFIWTKYGRLADNKIVEMKRIVEKYYISKQEHERIIKIDNQVIEKLEKELKKLKEKYKIQKSEEVLEETEEKKEDETEEQAPVEEEKIEKLKKLFE